MQDYYIHNAQIINEGQRFSGALYISGGLIREIFRGNAPAGYLFPENTVKIDAGQSFLLPGIIDAHVHFREPGLEAKGDIFTESRAAVAGGVTSYMEMPNTIPNATSLEILEQKFELASKRSWANYSFYLGASSSNLDEIRKAEPGKVCGLKLFLGSSTGNMKVEDPVILERIFRESPLLISVHAEDDELIRHNLAVAKEHYGEAIPPSAHPLIRNDEACFRSSAYAMELAEATGARLHLAHLSTARELSLLKNDQPLENKRITGEVCVHHLWFDEQDYHELGSLIRWNPAIKGSGDREALLEALLDNRIDLVATDHAPHLLAEKEKPYLECPSGSPLVQHSLVAMTAFYHLSKITMESIVEKMCHAPARLFRIQNRGYIRPGFAADLVLVNPDDPWTVEKENILYKCGWSPFEGVTFKSRVTHTWVNGYLVFDKGRFQESGHGERLKFRYE
jgi:dihydroorotase